MSQERNNESLQTLKLEIKAVQSSCSDACNIIENAPSDTQFVTPENVTDFTLRYIEGVRVDIENFKTAVAADDNLLTIQFLSELKKRSAEIEELKAISRARVLDLDNEIDRLEALLNTAEEVKSRPKVQKQDVRPEHLQKAKEKFHTMKTDLYGLIQSLFPNNSEVITEVLGQLMQERLNEESSGYIEITAENYQVIELLKDANLVTVNPYNNMEVKLAY